MYGAKPLLDAVRASLLLALALLMTAGSAHAVELCELNGASVNPNNGSTTAGKTGLMRCKEGDGGPVVREQELKNGVFMGVVRYFRDGVLQREYSVNERGNRDGRSREYAATPGTNQLLRDLTLRNGTPVGLARTWHANGQLKRATFYGDDAGNREQAYAEFTPQGQLSELRCGKQAVLAPAIDDASLCGFRGNAPAKAELYASNGLLRGVVTHERGVLRTRELLSGAGNTLEQLEVAADGSGVERSFGPTGAKRRELRWIEAGTVDAPRRVMLLEQEFHEAGTLVKERRWRAAERGSELQLEQQWYLNGQPREKTEYVQIDGQPARRETRFHDNGRVSFEGTSLLKARYENVAVGTQKSFDPQGTLRIERSFDARGRIAREREFDEAGKLLRDDEVFEDGSRKAFAR